MEVKVYGSGCPGCKKLYELTQMAVAEMGLDAKVEYITEIEKIIEAGIMSTPALMVDGKLVATGVSSLEKVKQAICADGAGDDKGGCTFGGKC